MTLINPLLHIALTKYLAKNIYLHLSFDELNFALETYLEIAFILLVLFRDIAHSSYLRLLSMEVL